MFFQNLLALFQALPLFLQIVVAIVGILIYLTIGYFVVGLHTRYWGRPTERLGDLNFEFFIGKMFAWPAFLALDICALFLFAIASPFIGIHWIFTCPLKGFANKMKNVFILGSWGFKKPEPLPEAKVQELLEKEAEADRNYPAF